MIGKSNLIKYIVSGSNTDTSDATAMPSDIKSSKTAYVANGKTIGTMPINDQFTYSLPVNGAYTIPEGYHDGTSIVNQNIEDLPTTEYTPTTSNIVIPSGKYLSGNQVIKGDSNLVAENIKSGVSIFGKNGTLSSGYTSSAIRTAYEKVLYLVGCEKMSIGEWNLSLASNANTTLSFSTDLSLQCSTPKEIFMIFEVAFKINGTESSNLYAFESLGNFMANTWNGYSREYLHFYRSADDSGILPSPINNSIAIEFPTGSTNSQGRSARKSIYIKNSTSSTLSYFRLQSIVRSNSYNSNDITNYL